VMIFGEEDIGSNGTYCWLCNYSPAAKKPASPLANIMNGILSLFIPSRYAWQSYEDSNYVANT